MNFSLSNFGKQNTPSKLQKVGDLLLLISAIGSIIASLPFDCPIIKTIGIYTAALGAIGKVITKFTGEDSTRDANPKPS